MAVNAVVVPLALAFALLVKSRLLQVSRDCLRGVLGDLGLSEEEATGNLCLGTKALVQERVGSFLDGLSSRKDEVKRRCRTVLQSRAGTLRRDIQTLSQSTTNAHPTLALV